MDLFERNVQCESVSRHLDENVTSPVLDSAVEMLSSDNNFNSTDLVEVPHSTPCIKLFRSLSHHDLPPMINPRVRSKSVNVLSPKRKSISFYSYLDLVNYEKMENISTNTSPSTNTSINTNTFANPILPKLQRRSTIQGIAEDRETSIDEELDGKNNNNKNKTNKIKIVNNFNKLMINEPIDPMDMEPIESTTTDDESIQSWNPDTDRSYFEDDLEITSTNTNNTNTTNTTNTTTSSLLLPPLLHVCSAHDYLHLRTRELRNSFVGSRPKQ